LEILGTCQYRLVGRTEIRRAAKEPRNILRKHIQNLAGGFASGDAFGIG